MDFTAILSKQADAIEAPKPLPVGTYLCVIQKVPEKVERGDFDILDFNLTVLSPGEDVDTSDYQGQIQGKVLRHSFLFNKKDEGAAEQTAFYLKSFLEKSLGIESTGKSLAQMISEVPGRQLLATVKWEMEKPDRAADPANPRVFERVGSTAAVS